MGLGKFRLVAESAVLFIEVLQEPAGRLAENLFVERAAVGRQTAGAPDCVGQPLGLLFDVSRRFW